MRNAVFSSSFLMGLFAAFVLIMGAGCRSASWVPQTYGAWDGVVYAATSSDGLEFLSERKILEYAGVPNLLRRDDDSLVMVYQYFSRETEEMFDVIAYSLSTDSGVSWSDPLPVNIVDLPEPLDSGKIPMDPTLVAADDGSLRLYFTYHAKGNANAALYVAVAEDGDMSSPFVVASPLSLSVEGVHLLDPAVTYYNGLWHHYSWIDGSDKNYHSTSRDGLVFTRDVDISLPMDFLGQVLPTTGGLRFYGTAKGNVATAFSSDGSEWTMEKGTLIPGVDPGIQQLADGSYLLVYVGVKDKK